jgi:hypothetical protein
MVGYRPFSRVIFFKAITITITIMVVVVVVVKNSLRN